MIAMPRARAKSRTARCSSRVMVQPVGLPGLEMKIALVRASQASNSLSRSRRQCGGDAFQSSSRLTKRVAAPQICAACTMLGQMGEMATILSPVSTTHCSAVDDGQHGGTRDGDAFERQSRRPVVRRWKRGAPRAGPGCPGRWYKRCVPSSSAFLAASRMKAGVTRSVSPNQRGIRSLSPSPRRARRRCRWA